MSAHIGRQEPRYIYDPDRWTHLTGSPIVPYEPNVDEILNGGNDYLTYPNDRDIYIGLPKEDDSCRARRREPDKFRDDIEDVFAGKHDHKYNPYEYIPENDPILKMLNGEDDVVEASGKSGKGKGKKPKKLTYADKLERDLYRLLSGEEDDHGKEIDGIDGSFYDDDDGVGRDLLDLFSGKQDKDIPALNPSRKPRAASKARGSDDGDEEKEIKDAVEIETSEIREFLSDHDVGDKVWEEFTEQFSIGVDETLKVSKGELTRFFKAHLSEPSYQELMLMIEDGDSYDSVRNRKMVQPNFLVNYLRFNLVSKDTIDKVLEGIKEKDKKLDNSKYYDVDLEKLEKLLVARMVNKKVIDGLIAVLKKGSYYPKNGYTISPKKIIEYLKDQKVDDTTIEKVKKVIGEEEAKNVTLEESWQVLKILIDNKASRAVIEQLTPKPTKEATSASINMPKELAYV